MIHLLPYSAKLQLTGPDTVTLLERLVTCPVEALVIGETTPGALLTPQGKVLSDFILTRTPDGCDLVLSPLAIDELEKRLKLFRLRADVQISRGEVEVTDASEADRIAAGLPAFGKDFAGGEVFPTDINLDQRGGVDYKKGCFVGQEVVSRMKRRGKIRKRTIKLSGAGMSAGDDVRAGEKLIGEVSSARENAVLARVRLDHLSTATDQNHPLEVNAVLVEPQLEDWLLAEMEALKHDA